MFEVRKTFEVSGAHTLELDYESKCCSLHGHNWLVTVKCQSEELDRNGMVVDFAEIEHRIKGLLDHKNITSLIVINGVLRNATAENIALFIAREIGSKCVAVRVQESNGNVAIWRAK